MRVLTLQPYYGESHRQFIDGWIANSRHEWKLLGLPGRHWKWRMRHAAIEFAHQLSQLSATDRQFDVILATDMMNAAELKGLLATQGEAYREVPIVVYFHENQFAYPNRFGFGSDQFKRDQHFAFTNFVSAIAADQVWFNSQYNIDSMLAGLQQHAKRWPDLRPQPAIQQLPKKFHVMSPGIEVPPIDISGSFRQRSDRAAAGQPIHLVWAARWEHDKNPDGLLAGLEAIQKLDVEFKLTVLGQRFRQIPDSLEAIKSKFSEQIVHWGFVENRQDYWNALAAGDVFLSTAYHEFFGLSAAEAIAVGLVPVFPDRVAYPELIARLLGNDPGNQAAAVYSPDHLLYEAGGTEAKALAESVRTIARRRHDGRHWQIPLDAVTKFANDLCWQSNAEQFDRRIEAVANARPPV